MYLLLLQLGWYLVIQLCGQYPTTFNMSAKTNIYMIYISRQADGKIKIIVIYINYNSHFLYRLLTIV